MLTKYSRILTNCLKIVHQSLTNASYDILAKILREKSSNSQTILTKFSKILHQMVTNNPCKFLGIILKKTRRPLKLSHEIFEELSQIS